MVLYSYSRDIPATNNDPSVDQPDMAINTNSIDDLLSQDHFNFNVANGGIHKQVRMPQRGGNPGTIPAGLIAQEGTIYTKEVNSQGVSTETGLFYTPDTSSNEYQLTRPITAKFSQFGVSSAYASGSTPTTQGGWTFLPGGLLMQYGKVTTPGNGSKTVNFPIAFTTACYSISISIRRDSGSGVDQVYVNSSTTGTFTYITTTGGTGFQSFDFIAIGK